MKAITKEQCYYHQYVLYFCGIIDLKVAKMSPYRDTDRAIGGKCTVEIFINKLILYHPLSGGRLYLNTL